MVARVKHLMRDLALLQHCRKLFRLGDTGRTDEHRLLALSAVLDLRHDGIKFLAHGAIDLVVVVLADHRHVGRHLDHGQAVDLAELGRLSGGGTGHAGKLGIEAEIVLESDRGEGLIFVLDIDAFLGLDGLMLAVRIAPTLHHAPGELIDDDNLVVFDDVLGVARKDFVRSKRLIDVMD